MHEVTELNHRALGAVIAKLRELEPHGPDTLLLLSPSDDDIAFLHDQFPKARLLVATRGLWDLNQPFPGPGRVDLVIASNVFHYSPEPERWFANVLGMTRYFIIQDLVTRRRSTAPDGLCDDGDRMRYSYSNLGIRSDFARAYDLAAQSRHVQTFTSFEGGRNEHHAPPLSAPVHYCALLKGSESAWARPPLRGSAYVKYRWALVRRVWRRRVRTSFRALGGR
jgi:hypothetical protein